MEQTAVEWLIETLTEEGFDLSLHTFETKQAKAMEKEQIINAHFDGQCDEIEGYPIEIAKQYYNETFKS